MEKHPLQFDVCILCALPEETRAFLEVVRQQCHVDFEEHIDARYKYTYRMTTIKNGRDEPLTLHISWLPRYGPQEMLLHLQHVLEKYQPCIVIMTGICAGDAQYVRLGDLVVAERTFTYDNGKFALDEHGRNIHLHDTITYQLDANILQFLGLFDDWKPLVAGLKRPPSPFEPHEIVCHIKAMASGNAVHADNPFKDVQAPVRDAVAIDMEGAAFSMVMSRYPLINWLIVKGVCDYADRAKSDAYHNYAANASALYALSFIQAYVTNERLSRPDVSTNRAKPDEPPASNEQQPVQEQKKPAHLIPFPPVWNVPYRYTFFFTGRDFLVEKLFANFTSRHDSGMVPIQALTGLGGMGKTQTAVEYAYRYRQHYRAVLWMRAETEEDLLASFKTAAELLKRSAIQLQQTQSLLASMKEWFQQTTDWLLILDNADNLALVEPFVPTSARGHVLLTTRATAMGQLAQPLALTPLVPDDGALCILRRANYVSWTTQLSDASPASVNAARELSQLMDGLPLALEQAGAYIETTGRSVSGYRDLYRNYRPEIQRYQYGEVPNYRDPVAFAWNIAREMVQQENAAAIELLHLCAFLAPEAIPYDLFTKGAHLLGPTLGPVAANPLAFDRAIALLRKHSLIKNEVDRETDISRLIIHPVLQEILQDGMDPQTQHFLAQRVVNAVAHAFSFVEWQIMQAHARRCLSLIEQLQMSSSEVDLIRQRFAAQHI